jgi:hypothetical protein
MDARDFYINLVRNQGIYENDDLQAEAIRLRQRSSSCAQLHDSDMRAIRSFHMRAANMGLKNLLATPQDNILMRSRWACSQWPLPRLYILMAASPDWPDGCAYPDGILYPVGMLAG